MANKSFELISSALVTYQLTNNDLNFLDNGQTIEVIVSSNCRLVIFPPPKLADTHKQDTLEEVRLMTEREKDET